MYLSKFYHSVISVLKRAKGEKAIWNTLFADAQIQLWLKIQWTGWDGMEYTCILNEYYSW